MASLHEQLQERRKRLQLLAGKAQGEHGQTSAVEITDNDEGREESEVKKPKVSTGYSGTGLHDNSADDERADSLVDYAENEAVDTELHESKRKPTSDLEEKLRPDLDELEKRTDDAIQRLVRQKYFASSTENDNIQ
ncbi:LAME_0H07492g1_1 [Lachancea meyersii CBS 8951]|uniref:LAME_0H07492g1_1 n=1 Tax=Lachancea meyersii CBS 8951 TaxID=1266667 RepID=A0A1G4KF01_9SACH|nr:LAME_0H07492g1_1 [Lachancea meyersii CBS 8951]